MILEEKFKEWLETEATKARQEVERTSGAYPIGRLDCLREIQRLLEFPTDNNPTSSESA
jgi:hypothetical protein